MEGKSERIFAVYVLLIIKLFPTTFKFALQQNSQILRPSKLSVYIVVCTV